MLKSKCCKSDVYLSGKLNKFYYRENCDYKCEVYDDLSLEAR